MNKEPTMIDRLFTAALAFLLLAGGTAAIGSAMFAPQSSQPAMVQLPSVEVTAHRVAQTESVRTIR
jgi:hypothetical protein